MNLYKCIAIHNDLHLFYKEEVIWISAKNLNDCSKQLKKLMKLKQSFTHGKKFFRKEIPKLKSISVVQEIKPF